MVKRLVDIVVSLALLVVASPVLALAALIILVTSPGPVLFRQVRMGRGYKPFEILKLRTMVVGAETMGAGLAVDRGDSRITRSGRLLRKLSVDELPQLWNVVRGEMSVIGPRPTLRPSRVACGRPSAATSDIFRISVLRDRSTTRLDAVSA